MYISTIERDTASTSMPASRKAPEKWTKERAEAVLNDTDSCWFSSLSSAVKRRLVERGRIINLRRNALLCRAEDAPEGIYAVLEGDVRAYLKGENGEAVFYRSLGPGAWNGITPILNRNARRMTTLRAHSQAVVLFVPRAELEAIAADRDGLAALVDLLCIINNETARLALDGRSDATVRTARAVLRLVKAHGQRTGDFAELDIRLSQADLASLVGVSRQYMNELIARWEKDALMQWRSSGRHRVNWRELCAMLNPADRDWFEAPGWA
ncbi:MAG: Crp/Fnr family transcriptional regulator [Alphaproteobacteria bacterium]|nr:Crp/Fnr family transcriptional regulator [Alphaproteobacteria bacterium]MDX5494823.1 Crp/Fnr family transcriptional regulator [Alphaproteobacteria bacterium]